MKHIKLISILLIAFFYTNVTNAQNVENEQEKSDTVTLTRAEKVKIIEAEAINLQISISNASIMGLDSAEFISWYSKGKGELLLKRFDNKVASTIKENSNKKIYYPKKDDVTYLLKIDIEAISEKAGINALLYLYKTIDNKSVELFCENIQIKDGRMNTFDILLIENAAKLAKKAVQVFKNKLYISYLSEE